jgi:LysR family hydrogen peroxide-inducible transcriptional activator
MELHQLRYFLAVVHSGSFTAAAQKSFVSQPSLSLQIAKLEDELGGRLFERGRAGARITERGKLLVPRAAAVMQQLESLRAEIDELDGLQRGELVLGCLPTTGAHILPVVLQEFSARHPDVSVQLREASSPGLAAMLNAYEIELAILDEAGLDDSMQTDVLFQEPLLVALPPDHPLAEMPAVKLASLQNEKFILMRPDHGFHTIVMRALRQAGIQPQVVYESAEIDTVQGLVAAGLGISLVPAMVRRPAGIAYAAVEDQQVSRSLFLVHRGQLSPAARAMREIALGCLSH